MVATLTTLFLLLFLVFLVIVLIGGIVVMIGGGTATPVLDEELAVLADAVDAQVTPLYSSLAFLLPRVLA
jgi:uncharacterized protein (UPF0333 family)